MARENKQVLSGNIIVAQFDGKNVGLIQSVDLRDDYSPEPASGIGDIHVKEYVPTMARHTLSIEEMVLSKNNLLEAGINPENGDGALKGLVFDIICMNKDTGKVYKKYMSCSFASGSVSVRKHSIVVSSAQYNALDVTGGV